MVHVRLYMGLWCVCVVCCVCVCMSGFLFTSQLSEAQLN